MPFFGGQTSTYLIITESHVMRADVRGEQLVKLTKEDRPVGTTLPIAVELACGLTGKKPAQKTYVVADDFWTGVVDLDERSIYGLAGEELEQMLRFETESLSNLGKLAFKYLTIEGNQSTSCYHGAQDREEGREEGHQGEEDREEDDQEGAEEEVSGLHLPPVSFDTTSTNALGMKIP